MRTAPQVLRLPTPLFPSFPTPAFPPPPPLDNDDPFLDVESATSEPAGTNTPNTPNTPPTRLVLNAKKVAVECCNGPLCRTKEIGVRFARQCSFNHCIKCCIKVQHEQNKKCAHQPHSQKAGVTPSTTLYDPQSFNNMCPLHQRHYDAMHNTERRYQDDSQRRIEAQTDENALRRTVELYYWQDDSGHAECFRITLKSEKAFSLESCSRSIHKLLGVEEEGLIEAYEVDKETWRSHEAATVRPINGFDKFLYRARGVKKGVKMDDLMLELSKKPGRRQLTDAAHPRTPLKRCASQDMTFSGSLTQSGDTMVVDTRHIKQRLDPLEATPTMRHTGQTLLDLSLDDEEDDLPHTNTLFKNPPHAQSTPAATQCFAQTQTSGSTGLTDGDYDVMPSTTHSEWPLMYVKSMAKGFAKCSTITGVSIADKFKTGFLNALKDFKFSSSSWHSHENIWLAAPESLKERYILAGYTKVGYWCAFVNEVKEEYGGKIPSKRELKKRST
ncbi:hypothetical protein EYR40_004632 [Pleurotus pulmonarius]|nr:hypothetical protein EYR38_001873 [Pleurotus pulmonarius]KAF4605842.1 hypothetical protein EYR40_004632 [Pleurotus pulmonarius]